MNDPVRVSLDPATIEAIAQRIAEILRTDHPHAPASSSAEDRYLGNDGGRLVDAAELAGWLGVEREWVYEHAAELGALRLGDGPRARLRFDLERVVERLAACPEGRGPGDPPDGATTPTPRPRRRRRTGTGAELLPIRGREA
jgi:hypothetical protein